MHQKIALIPCSKVRIPRADNQILSVSAKDFKDLTELFNLEPLAVYLLARNSYGFRHLPPSGKKAGVHTFFVGTVSHMLIWSFDSQTLRTGAILMPRFSSHYGGAQVTWELVTNLLKCHERRIFSPGLLVFVSAVFFLIVGDRHTIRQQKTIRDIEVQTGYGAWIMPG